ncbi:MAG: hypothetical protein KKF85_12090 [Gammaproteobacteria bacterium]|nr:hypothetical protein [Rhodocyclaceae bacterium]MBU3909096.1 hypothetical protein [Gammaproteobacteria bacterium]MBU3990797.1 hypothetical protein [Gammaproteobacteria bacterium]MBU4003307.1 hypothetical protein [Gammaproteobacteria bacterium]MBU4022139.1 hypothetical protein [Gammaproteobacteria bacterium]
MQEIPKELTYLSIFVAIVLFQFLMKRFGPQAEKNDEQRWPLDELPEELTEVPAPAASPKVAVGHFGVGKVTSASSPLPQRRFSKRSLIGTRRDVQNAIVIATILGPCRAFEPHDVR